VTTTEIAVEQTENLPDVVVPQQVDTESAADASQVKPPSGVELRWVDPNKLLIGVNTRTKPVLPKWFVDDIKDRGVREPIPARENSDGDLVVRKGQRRTLAACEAWADAVAKGKEPRLVPVLVEPELITDEVKRQVDRIIDQLGENEHREAISDADEARATQELLELGLSAALIAKKRHVATKRVKTAAQVACSDTAMELLAKGHVGDLMQAAVIAEFGDDEEAVQKLAAAASKQPEQFDHIAQRLRDDREESKFRAELEAQLAEQKVTVIEQPKSAYQGPIRKLGDLRPTAESASGTELTVEAHQDCPGHAAYISYRSWRPVEDRWETCYVCTDARAHGHDERWTLSSTTPQAGPMTDEQKAERKEVVANNKAWRSAETVRRDWVRNFLKRKGAPKDGVRWALITLAEGSHAVRKAMESDHELAIDLLGMPKLDVPAYYRRTAHPITAAAEHANAARSTTMLVGLVIAALDKSTGTHTWRNPSKVDKSYLGQLAKWGYPLSDIERMVVEHEDTTASGVDEDTENTEEDEDAEEGEDSGGTVDELDDDTDVDQEGADATSDAEVEETESGNAEDEAATDNADLEDSEQSEEPQDDLARAAEVEQTTEYDADIAA
jgi:ParB family chromosome partitioning protein